MKKIIIGDLHGYDTWKHAIAKFGEPILGELEYIILGDYFDSFRNNAEQCIKNFKELIEYKKLHNDDSFVLIYGNHDHHYLQLNEYYSGYQYEWSDEIEPLLRDAIENDLIVPAYKFYTKDTVHVCTHAGITQKWYDRIFFDGCGMDIDDLFSSKLLKTVEGRNIFNFYHGTSFDVYGNTSESSPIWVRPTGFIKSPYRFADREKCMQWIGHTPRQFFPQNESTFIRETTNKNVCFGMCDIGPVVTVIDYVDENSYYNVSYIRVVE